MKIERVVVFGHKPAQGRDFLGRKKRTHTHSYIHAGYFRAFSYLGYETYWLDGSTESLKDFPTAGTLFFTEDQADELIPLSADSLYVTHSSSKTKYEEFGAKRLNLCNFVSDLEAGISYNYPGQTVQKLDSVTYFDAVSNALYQPWATDLLPSEITDDLVQKFDPSRRKINYVGTIGHDNIARRYLEFSKAAAKREVEVLLHSGVSDQQARELVRESLFTIDIRGDWHLERGYIPCRLWKNLSYGMSVSSNSQKLQSIFGDRVGFDPDARSLFETGLEKAAATSAEEIRDNMSWIRESHTFVNRANRCVEFLTF